MRICPQAALRSPGFTLKLRERLIVRRIPPVPPREPRFDQLVIQAPPVWQEYQAHRAPIAISIHDLHGDSGAEDQLRRELLGAVAERLALLRAVDAVEPNAFALAVVQHGDGVAVRDTDHAAREVGGEGLTLSSAKLKNRDRVAIGCERRMMFQ